MTRGGGAARRPKAGQWPLIALVLAYLGVLMLGPVAALVIQTFSEGLGPLIAALGDRAVVAAFLRTFVIAAICVAVHGVLGTAVAFVLVRQRFAFQRFVNAWIDLPFAVSPVVAGYMLLLLFGRRGLLGPLLEALGIKIVFAFPGMVLATLFVTLPFMIRELMPALAALGTEQEQAAEILGASRFQTFRLVTLPALRDAFLYGAVLTFARAIGEFGAVLVVGGGVQGVTETATLFIYRALDEREYASACGAALCLGAASLALVLAAELLRRRGPRRARLTRGA